ncbi:MAG: usg protein [Alphaproteobacteria bacterium]|nr:usg protein [Alphaproteobacteria bacterium]
MADLERQLFDYRLTTAQIFYHMPDHVHLLQEYVWQDYDLAPQFPVLQEFLLFWNRSLEGRLHSVYIAERKLITAGDLRFAEFEGHLE